MATAKQQGRTLNEYVRAKRREACAVCRLPDDIREQMISARKAKLSRETVLDWLREEHGVEITHDQMTSHGSAHHDRREP